MLVNAVMSSPVVTVEADDTLKVVNDIFANTAFHHLAVVENGRLLGIISDRNLLKAISPNLGKLAETTADLATLNKRVHQIMSRDPVCLSAYADLNDAVRIFDEHRFSCIPIIDDRQHPVGMLSWRDIIRVIRQKNAPVQQVVASTPQAANTV